MSKKLLQAAEELINSADDFNKTFPDAAQKTEELFMPGLSRYNNAFELLRSEVSKLKNNETNKTRLS